MSENAANAGKIKNDIEIEIIKFIQAKASELEKLTGLSVIEAELEQTAIQTVAGRAFEIHGFRFVVD